MPALPSIPNALTANLLSGARAAGISLEPVLQRAGLVPQPDSLTIADFVQLMRAVTLTMDDEYAGQIQRPQRIGTFAITAAHMSHGATLRDALERFAAFTNMLDNSFHVTLRHGAETTRLHLERTDPAFPITELGAEMVLVLPHRLLAWMGGGWLPLREAWFDYPRPTHHAIYGQLFPKARLSFQRASCGYAIPSAALDAPVIRSEKQAADWARRTPLDAFLPVSLEDGLPLRVAQRIAHAIEAGQPLPSMQAIADALQLPVHTLRRRLKREGRDVPEIRRAVRRDHALRLLGEGDLRIDAIALRLGYSETSAFVRAFKDWTGVTPRAYRQSGQPIPAATSFRGEVDKS